MGNSLSHTDTHVPGRQHSTPIAGMGNSLLHTDRLNVGSTPHPHSRHGQLSVTHRQVWGRQHPTPIAGYGMWDWLGLVLPTDAYICYEYVQGDVWLQVAYVWFEICGVCVQVASVCHEVHGGCICDYKLPLSALRWMGDRVCDCKLPISAMMCMGMCMWLQVAYICYDVCGGCLCVCDSNLPIYSILLCLGYVVI